MSHTHTHTHTALKDANEDYGRHKSDAEENARPVWVFDEEASAFHIVPWRNVVVGDMVHFSVAVWCSVVQCVAVCCCVLLCVAVCCVVLECALAGCRCRRYGTLQCCSVVQCVAVCCCVMLFVAVCCAVL